MMDIELVIRIPEELYKAYKGRPPMLGDAGMDMIAQSIANGTPLPKGHGRLIDADVLYDSAKLCHTEEDGTACVEWREINDAPTIIEAEREG